MHRCKVVQLSSVHPSNDTRIFHKMCKSLAANGYDLDLVIQHPKDEIMEGVNIIALPEVKKKLDRLIKVVPSLARICFKYDKNTVFQIHDSELIPLGLVLKFFGYKIIYDAHENTPQDFLTKEWIPFVLRYPLSQVVRLLEYLADSFFDGIITTTVPITERYNNRNLSEIRNYPKLTEDYIPESVKHSGVKKDQIIYVGSITQRRGIFELVTAMGLLGKEYNTKLILGGKFAPSDLIDEISKLDGWSRCDFLGWLSIPELWKNVSQSKVGMVTILPTSSHFTQLPVKLFEYMAAGIPVVCSDFPMYREIVEQVGCGILVNPDLPEEIASAIKWLLSNPEEAEIMGSNGKKAVTEVYNWETEELKLLALYKKIVTNSKN